MSVRDKQGRDAARDRVVWYDPREPKDAEEARRFDADQETLLKRLRTRTAEAELVFEIERARNKEVTKRLELRVDPVQENPSNHR